MTLEKTITGDHVSLRPILENDIVLWSVWDNDDIVQQYMPEPRVILSEVEQLEYFQECIQAEDEVHATIIENTTGYVIGTISLTEMNTYHGIGEFGIVMGNTQVWGRGYATEAIYLFLSYIRSNTIIVRITAEHDSENIGILKVLEKAGFITECVCRGSRVREGKRVDTVRCVKMTHVL